MSSNLSSPYRSKLIRNRKKNRNDNILQVIHKRGSVRIIEVSIFLENLRTFSEGLLNEKLRTAVSDFMYLKTQSLVIYVVRKWLL